MDSLACTSATVYSKYTHCCQSDIIAFRQQCSTRRICFGWKKATAISNKSIVPASGAGWYGMSLMENKQINK